MVFKIFFASDLSYGIPDEKDKPFEKINIKKIEELDNIFRYYDENVLTVNFKNVKNGNKFNYIIINNTYE